MERNKKSLLIIFEPHMNDRYEYMAKKFNMEVFNVNLKNQINNNILLDLLLKIIEKQKLIKKSLELKKVIKELTENKLTIYVSNSEGYVAHNCLIYLKKEFPSIEIIAMQHGIMPLSYNRKKRVLRNFINSLFKIIFRIYPYGTGFGIKLSDKYIVYTEQYKELLVQLGWDKKDVVVDLNFLKCELSDFYNKNKSKRLNSDTALFLPQCLYLAKICTYEEEKELLKYAITYIAKKHKRVMIKNHPACRNINFSLPKNCEYIDDLKEALILSTFAYSFFSTSLIDAEIFEIKAVAFKSKTFNKKIDFKIYNLFKNVKEI